MGSGRTETSDNTPIAPVLKSEQIVSVPSVSAASALHISIF